MNFVAQPIYENMYLTKYNVFFPFTGTTLIKNTITLYCDLEKKLGGGRFGWFWFMVFSDIFDNISGTCISRRSVLFLEETGVPGETHRPVASH